MGDLTNLIRAVGLVGIWSMLFAETGLLVGFFLPGDSLLFTAGFLASQGLLGIGPLVIGSVIAAIIGDSTGYAIGRRIGVALYRRPDSRFFRRERLERAHAFYQKYGAKTIVLARFVPIVRTFAPVLAGVSEMPYATFITYNVLGGIGWAAGLSIAGYYLGSVIPNVDHYLLPIVGVIIVLSLLPAANELRGVYRNRKS